MLATEGFEGAVKIKYPAGLHIISEKRD